VILVDTSVWIELLAGRMPSLTAGQLLQFATCGPVVQEVLQGLRPRRESVEFQESFLALPCLSDPLSLGLFLEAANIFREGRRQGYTIRSTMDCLIAAIAIENTVAVWHRDRDFDTIAKYTPLRVSPPLVPRVQ